MTDNKDIKESEVMIDNGLLGDGYQSTDFLLVNGNGLPTLYDQDDKIFEYNQGSTNDCTIYSAFGAVSDLMNYEFSAEEIKDINELSYSMGRKRGNGWFVFKAVDCVRKRWNNNEKLVKQYGKVASYRLDLTNDELVNEILSKGYTLCSGYDGNGKYNVDFSVDDQLDGTSFGSPTYGHAVSWRMVNGERCIKDNYKGRSCGGVDTNIYKVIPSCSELVANNVYFANAYLFTKVAEDNYEELKRLNQMKTLLETACDCHSQLRHLTNDTKYKNFLHDVNETHRSKIKDCDAQIILHS